MHSVVLCVIGSVKIAVRGHAPEIKLAIVLVLFQCAKKAVAESGRPIALESQETAIDRNRLFRRICSTGVGNR